MIWIVVIFGLLVAIWGGVLTVHRWDRRVAQARRGLAEFERKRVGL